MICSWPTKKGMTQHSLIIVNHRDYAFMLCFYVSFAMFDIVFHNPICPPKWCVLPCVFANSSTNDMRYCFFTIENVIDLLMA